MRPHRKFALIFVISLILFEVNNVAEQKKEKLAMISLFFISFHCSQLLLRLLPTATPVSLVSYI